MATKEHVETLYQRLQQSDDYRQFLQIYLKARELSLADFARATGYGRSFPSEVLNRKRRLTFKSAYIFEKALKLPICGKNFFKLLVAQEEHDSFPEINRVGIVEAIHKLRTKSWQAPHRQIQEFKFTSLVQLLADSRAMGVYAAAGEPRQGATLEQIAGRTRLYGRELERLLDNLEQAELLKKQKNIYIPKDFHLFLKTMDQSALLTAVFQKSCRLAANRIEARQNEVEMFFASQFCVREEELPKLKKALRDVVLKFIDDAIQPNGDRVVHFVTALHL